eukprot:scaffold88153_cov21-Tisochrysis_lutea.AAC.1
MSAKAGVNQSRCQPNTAQTRLGGIKNLQSHVLIKVGLRNGHHAPAAGCGGATQTADASMHGALSYDDLSVLHFFQGERCDVLFTSTRFQGSSIAALLKGVLCSIDQGCGGAEQSDKSKVFLEMLLGAERAQAAEAAVLEGLPFV